MNIGYFFWGHLGDKLSEKTVNTPDGNAWYSFSIIYELVRKGHKVFGLTQDNDKYDYELFGDDLFKGFAFKYRLHAYKNLEFITWEDLKIKNKIKLDLILLEWRFPIVYRNVYQDSENFSPDLYMQFEILKQYKDIPIFILNLDYKLTIMDELFLKTFLDNEPIVIETANKPYSTILKRLLLDIPFMMKNMKPLSAKLKDKIKHLVYIGNMYEREEMIEKYIIPYSNKFPYRIWFYGNWVNEPYKTKIDKYGWNKINYNGRVGHSKFYGIYSDAALCPLLAKKEYCKYGFMTARIIESLYFGCLPIGFSEFYKIEKYLPNYLICSDVDQLQEVVDFLLNLKVDYYNSLILEIWDHLKFMDAEYFVEAILKNA